MEIMYINKTCELFDKKINCIYGDKLDLINIGCEFEGIEYDDEWSIKKFLNGSKLYIDNNIFDIFNELDIKISLLLPLQTKKERLTKRLLLHLKLMKNTA